MLNKGLKLVLFDASIAENISLDAIQDSFIRRSSTEKYLTVGLLLSEVISPLLAEMMQSAE